jgi:uncharacterized membrane protein
MEANSEAADEEKERIERLAEAGAISEEQKNARIALSDQQLKAKQDALDLQKRQAQARQAKYEQSLALLQTIINGGLAVSKAFAQLGPIAGAIAAIAIAAVIGVQAAKIAQPIPQYAKGTPRHPGGPAVVGDGGRAEGLRIGNMWYKTPATPTLIPNLAAGAEVIPDWNDVIKNSLVSDLITDNRATNYYDVSPAAYDDKNMRRGFERQSDQMERLIREIRRGRQADKTTTFKNIKISGIA